MFELVAWPLAAGMWVHMCGLPLTSASVGQRLASLQQAPLLLSFVHWLLGGLPRRAAGALAARCTALPPCLPICCFVHWLPGG